MSLAEFISGSERHTSATSTVTKRHSSIHADTTMTSPRRAGSHVKQLKQYRNKELWNGCISPTGICSTKSVAGRVTLAYSKRSCVKLQAKLTVRCAKASANQGLCSYRPTLLTAEASLAGSRHPHRHPDRHPHKL